MALKPSELKVTGKYRSIKEHEDLVRANLKRLKNKLLGAVCNDILDSSPGDILNIGALSKNEISDIKNYFAEVAGPVLMLKNKMYRGISTSSKCFFSDSDTERLFDFKLVIAGNEVLISNKQLSGGTNTLKPGDVVRLVDEDRELTKKWKNSLQYKVCKTLDESNVISGPMRAVKDHYPRKLKITSTEYDALLNKMTSNEVMFAPKEVPGSIMALIAADPVAYEHYKKNGGAMGSMINFLFEKQLVTITKEDSTYHDLFVDITIGNVSFFKFDLSPKSGANRAVGVIDFQIADPRQSHKKAVFRSKQGVERRSSSTGKLKLDKLGFQP
jgi:hypothetical protein